ncbi:MAG: hypothetical protein ACI8PZ_000669 [Myxococcota bacterium]|jgi:hypothetical protein
MPVPPNRRTPVDDSPPPPTEDWPEKSEEHLESLADLNDVPDDDEGEDDWEEPTPEPLSLDIISDDDGDDEEPQDAADEPEPPWISEPAVLPWQLDAVVDGRRVVVVLDPTRATSTWEGGDTRSNMALDLDGTRVVVDLTGSESEVVRIRLGRDALADRIWVRAE